MINKILFILEKFLKIHIKNQIDNGAEIIQIFDSWAGLLEEKDLPNYIYSPTLNLVNYVKSLNTPVICSPREIKNYKKFCDIVKPDAVSIDYNTNPKKITSDIQKLTKYHERKKDLERRMKILENSDLYKDKKELNKKASASDLNVTAIGHAHIDTGWLWPVKETIRKCARTFSTQLALMRKYPKYKFGASQPQHYQFVKDHYPKIYSEVKKAVKKGQWELQGGMWVEADCNLISGESMVRQILHGKNFLKVM